LQLPLVGYYGLVLDWSNTCEFAGSNRDDMGRHNGQLDLKDLFQALPSVKGINYKEFFTLVQTAF
jgi:hypothetical protein